MRLTLAAGDDIAALVRATPGGASLVVVIAPGRDSFALAQVRAAIGPLAVERAPASRVNAVFPGADARNADVEAAIAWLDGASSTTGQLIDVRAPA